MKIITLLILIFSFNNLFAVEWKLTNTKNSNILSNNIFNFFERDNGELWYSTDKEIGKINFNNDTIDFEADISFRKNDYIYNFSNCVFDDKNNLICRGSSGLGIKNLNDNKWQLFSNEENNYLTFRSSLLKFGDKLLLNTTYPNQIVAFKYDESSKAYQKSENDKLASVNNIDEEFGFGMTYLDSMLIFINFDKINLFDLNNKSIRSITFNDNNIFKNVSQFKYLTVIEDNIIFSTQNKDSSMSLFIADKKIETENDFEMFTYKTKFYNPQYIDVTDICKYDDDTYFLAFQRELLMFKNKTFYIVKTPDILDNDINLEWLPRTLEIYNNELIVGTMQGGIFRVNIEEIVNETLILNSIEDGINYSKNQINIYPNPVNELLNIDIDLKKSQRVNYKIFDLNLKLLDSDELLNNQINVSKLSKGTYIFEIDDTNHISKIKFIKE